MSTNRTSVTQRLIMTVFILPLILSTMSLEPRRSHAEGLDVVTLKDGSILYGEVVDMVDGKLRLKTKFGVDEVITIKWENVSQLTTSRPLPFHLKDGTTLMGTVQSVEKGQMLLKAEPLAGPVTFNVDSVTRINPPVKPPVEFRGQLYARHLGCVRELRVQERQRPG